jgi:hypothetical protein
VRRGGAGGGRAAGGRGLGRRKPERPRRRRQRRPSRLEAWVGGGSGCGRGLRSERAARLPASPARRDCLEDGAGRMEILMTVSKFASICTMVGAAAARPGGPVPAFEAPPAGLVVCGRTGRGAEWPRGRRAGHGRRGRDTGDRTDRGSGLGPDHGVAVEDGELWVWAPGTRGLWLGTRAWGLRDGVGGKGCRLGLGTWGLEVWTEVGGWSRDFKLGTGTGKRGDCARGRDAAFPWGPARGRAGVCGRKEGSRSYWKTEVLAEFLLGLGGAPGPGSGRGRVKVETFKSAVEMFSYFQLSEAIGTLAASNLCPSRWQPCLWESVLILKSCIRFPVICLF